MSSKQHHTSQQEHVLPETQDVQNELERSLHRNNIWNRIRSTAFLILLAAAIVILVAVLFLPVLKIYGTSMQDTLKEGNIVMAVKSSEFQSGDIVAFYYNNNILVKRVIAISGDTVDMDQDGTVSVNGKELDEPYLSSKAYGDTNINLPYQVPKDKLFVMGDHRNVSVDSRNRSVGCLSSEQILGKVVFRLWPLTGVGPVS